MFSFVSPTTSEKREYSIILKARCIKSVLANGNSVMLHTFVAHYFNIVFSLTIIGLLRHIVKRPYVVFGVRFVHGSQVEIWIFLLHNGLQALKDLSEGGTVFRAILPTVLHHFVAVKKE